MGKGSSILRISASGLIIKLLNDIKSSLAGDAGQARWEFSQSGPVEEDSVKLYSIVVYDVDGGAIVSANIDITSIVAEMAKSTGGGAFSTAGITQPSFAKADGRIFQNYRHLAAEWEIGDMGRLKVSGITFTIGTTTIYVPSAEWSFIVMELQNVEAKIDVIDSNVDQIIAVTVEDSFIKITTDAGVNDFAVLRIDIPTGKIQVYDSDEVSNWKDIETGLSATGKYEFLDMVFDLMNDNSGSSKSFDDLSSAGTIAFGMKKEVNGNPQLVGAPQTKTQGSIESDPIADGDEGNPMVDDFTVSDYIEVWITTSEALTDLEIPLRFNHRRIG